MTGDTVGLRMKDRSACFSVWRAATHFHSMRDPSATTHKFAFSFGHFVQGFAFSRRRAGPENKGVGVDDRGTSSRPPDLEGTGHPDMSHMKRLEEFFSTGKSRVVGRIAGAFKQNQSTKTVKEAFNMFEQSVTQSRDCEEQRRKSLDSGQHFGVMPVDSFAECKVVQSETSLHRTVCRAACVGQSKVPKRQQNVMGF